MYIQIFQNARFQTFWIKEKTNKFSLVLRTKLLDEINTILSCPETGKDAGMHYQAYLIRFFTT